MSVSHLGLDDVERSPAAVAVARHGEVSSEIADLDEASRAAWARLLDQLERRLADARVRIER